MKAKKTILFILLFTTLTILCYAADAVGDYRSRSTGLWTPTVEFPTMNWQICTVAGDPGTWVTASVVPDETAGVITIRNGHMISIELNQSADQIVVQSGGTLRIINNQVLTVKSGAGTDLDIQAGGNLQLFGNIYSESSSTVQISGTYRDLENCQIQGLGAVTVAAGATVNTKNAYGIYLFGETIRGCFAVSSRTLNTAANYIFSSTIDPQVIYALPTTVNNLTADNSGIDESLVTLRDVLSANAVAITSGALTLGGNTSLNTLTLNGNQLNFATYYVYFNNQHFSVGGKNEHVTTLTVAEDQVTTYELGGDYGTSIPRTWTTSATQSNPLNIIFHYPDELTETSRVNVWSRNTGATTWNLYGKYSPTLADGIHKVTVPNVVSLNHSSGVGTLEWTISEEEPTTPVELSSFTATPTSTGFMRINWITQSETGVLGFYVFRGTNNVLNNSQAISPMLEATNTSQEVSYNYIDSEIPGFGTYYYWLQNVDLNGVQYFNGPISIVVNEHNYTPPPVIPTFTVLKNVFPNPFNPNTMISYNMAKAGNVTIVVYNLKGEAIRNLVSGHKTAGSYQMLWDGTSNNGQSQPSGAYLIRMTAGKYSSTQKAILMK